MKFVPKIDLSLQTAEAEISIEAPPRHCSATVGVNYYNPDF